MDTRQQTLTTYIQSVGKYKSRTWRCTYLQYLLMFGLHGPSNNRYYVDIVMTAQRSSIHDSISSLIITLMLFDISILSLVKVMKSTKYNGLDYVLPLFKNHLGLGNLYILNLDYCKWGAKTEPHRR